MSNDLISREALKKAIEEYKYCGFYDKLIELIDNAPAVEANSIIDGLNNEIDDLSENLAWYINERNRLLKERRLQGKWIPVSERLPEALQSVLVTSKSGRVYTSYIAHGDWEYGGEVIAWQPLPEPYKKGGAEK